MFSKKMKISNEPCASLSKKVKRLNGKSAERLRESIQALDEALEKEESEEEGSEKTDEDE